MKKKKSKKLSRIHTLLPFIAAPLLLGGASYLQKSQLKTYTVVQVINGDTFEIENGKHIRLIGIDTPEKNECYDRKLHKNLRKTY